MTHRGRRPGWRRLLAGSSLAVAVLTAGCGSTVATETPTTYVAVAGKVISFGMNQGPTGCNPHTPSGDTAATQLLLGGVLPSPYIVNPQGVPTANPNFIVQSELVSTKPETIVYTLNPRAVWSDGVPITAKDFIYAWEQERSNPASGSDTVASVEGYRDIASVVGTNSGRTVTVVFHNPFADWQMLFANLLPAHVMEKIGWDPSCTTVSPFVDVSGGPFELGSVSPTSITLKDNPKWWGVQANARQIVVHIAKSTGQLASWVRTGYVQVALPSTTTPSFLSEITSLPGAESAVNLSNTLLQLDIDAGPSTPFSPDVRFAIALSIDRQALVTQKADWALPGIQVGSSNVWVQGQSGYHAAANANPPSSGTPGGPTTSSTTSTTLIGQGGTVNFPTTPVLAQADALMEASGMDRTEGSPWHTDFGVPFTLHLVVDDADPWAVAAAPLIQQDLEAAGFAITVYSVSGAATAGSVMANGFATLALVPRTSSPFLSQSLAWYTPLLGVPGQNGSEDWSTFDDPTFNQLLTTASQQLSPTAAAVDYATADKDLWDQMVALPLFTEPSTLAWSRTIGGVTPTPVSDSLLWYAQFWAVRVPESTSSTTPALPGQ